MARVRVYWNGRKRVFSVQDRKSRRVIDYRPSLALANPRYVVSEPGRQKVVAKGQRSVHAYLEGELTELAEDPIDPRFLIPLTHPSWSRISYNPYRAGFFTIAGTSCPAPLPELIYARVEEGSPAVYAFSSSSS